MNYFNIEFRLILFLSVLLGIFIPVLNFSQNEIAIFLIFYLLEIGHIYASFLKSFNNECLKKSKYIFIASILINCSAIIIFPTAFFVFLFYFTLLHYIQKSFEYTSYYAEGNRVLRVSLLLFIISLFLAFHFREIKLGTDLNYELRPINIHHYFTANLASQIYYLLNSLGLLTLAVGFFYSVNRLKFQNMFVYLFTAFLWGIALSCIDDIYSSMALLIIPHAIFSYFETFRSIKKHSSFIFVKKFAIILMATSALFASIIEVSIEDNSYHFYGFVKVLLQAIAFFPLTYHYLFEFVEFIETTYEQH